MRRFLHIVLAALLMVSCDAFRDDPWADYSLVVGGVGLVDGDDILQASVRIDGPERWEWTVGVSIGDVPVCSRLVTTGDELLILAELPEGLERPGTVLLLFKASCEEGGVLSELLELELPEAPVPPVPPVTPDDGPLSPYFRRVVCYDSGFISHLVFDDSELAFVVGSSQEFVLALSDERLSLSVLVEGAGLSFDGISGSTVKTSCNGEGHGTISFVAAYGDESESFKVFYRIDPVDEPPVERWVELRVPDVNFAGCRCPLTVDYSGFAGFDSCTLSVTLDGSPVVLSEGTGDARYCLPVTPGGMGVCVVIGTDEPITEGVHELVASIEASGGGEAVRESSSVRASFCVPVWTWYNEYDGSGSGAREAREGLVYRKSGEQKSVVVDLRCDPSGVLGATMDEGEGGVTVFCREGGGRDWWFSFGQLSRGEHRFRLCVDTSCGLFSFTRTIVSRDGWTLVPFVSNGELRMRIKGPSGFVPCEVSLSVKMSMQAYIPYQSAEFSGGEYIIVPKGTYIDLGYEQQSVTIAKGSAAAAVTLWTGDIDKGIAYARKQAGKVSVTKNGASRWVQNGGIWTKEYYTPEVVPTFDVFVYGQLGNGNDGYLVFSMDYETLRDWLSERGIGLKGREYWD